jgi:type II secretory pathway predicted ATPase ExeA
MWRRAPLPTVQSSSGTARQASSGTHLCHYLLLRKPGGLCKARVAIIKPLRGVYRNRKWTVSYATRKSERETLKMYLKYWGLTAAPFRQTLDPSLFCETPTHNEALARLWFLVDGRRRCGLLAGGAGVGKSMLLETLAAQLRRGGLAVAGMSLLGISSEELLRGLAICWGAAPPPRASISELWQTVEDRLTEFRLLGKHAVALLDDADETTSDVLAKVVRLSQTAAAQRPAVTVILAARTESILRVGTRWLELTDLKVELTPWTVEQLCALLGQALARVGRRAPLFSPGAVERLHEYSRGAPRNLLQLADLALVAGAAGQRDWIDAEVIESVYYELGVIETLV